MKKITKIIYGVVVFILFIAILSYIANIVFLSEQPATLFSFGFINFAGYLFFLLMPVEALFPYYIVIGNNPIIAVIVAVVTALLAQAIDYAFGRAFSHKIIDGIISQKRYDKYNKVIDKWGGPAILFFNLFPLASSVLLLVAGIVRFNWRKALLYSAIGLTIKYSVIALFF